MSWAIEWSSAARKDLRRLDQQTAHRVYQAIERFATTGHGDIRALRGYPGDLRLRVGDIRVRFRSNPDEQLIMILRILPRERAYED